MVDKLLLKFFGWIDSLNEKINDLLTFKLCSCKKKKKKIKKLLNSDNIIDTSVDVSLIVFDVLSSPILMVMRIIRFAFKRFVRNYIIKTIKYLIGKVKNG